MPYRPIASLWLPPEADIDTPEMVEAAIAIERDDEDVAMLMELAQIGMRLARAQEAYAAARLAAAAGEGPALNPGEEPTGAFSKIAQTVRRTVALKKQLADDVKTRRAGLIAERTTRRAKQTEDHASAVKAEIENALVDAYEADLILPDFDPQADPYKPEPYEIERREMLDDAEMLLGDLDDFRDYLSRPVGETVARLCAALGFEPGGCVKEGDAWLVRRSNTEFELLRDEKRASLPPTCGEGQIAKRSGWGAAAASGDGGLPAAPHPDGFAVGPSP